MSSNQSYVHGASEKPLIGQTIGRFFDEACARHAGREALVVRYQNVRFTYAQLKSRVDALACGLMRLGLAPELGYWDDEAKTREAIDAGGWMHTGDLAVIDDEGYCNIVGRIKDMVIRGGENIYPREIEEFLYAHPKVLDVQVVGIPDEKFGEELCAWIIVREGESLSEDEVRAYCQGQIAHYKIPRYIRFVDGFPMTVTGKIQKFQIRQKMKEELGLDEAQTA